MIDETLQEIRLRNSPDLAQVFFNCCRQKDAQKAMAKLQSQPLRPFTEGVNVGEKFKRVSKRSLVSRYDRALLLSDQLRMSRGITENIVYLDADHAVYCSAVKQMIDELLR